MRGWAADRVTSGRVDIREEVALFDGSLGAV